MNKKIKCPDYIVECIERLESSGFSAYAVGGAVRDRLMGREPSDWDVATSATPDEMLRVFSEHRIVPTGIGHGTLTVLFPTDDKDIPVEITTYRIDGEYRDFRHPTSVSFANDIADDLSRRDLTVNAMAYNDRCGIVDLFGGERDIERRIVRTVGEPRERFFEDALRILRAFRFSAQLGFEIDEQTLVAAEECAPLLRNVARERVWVEIKKLLASENCAYPLGMMIECGVWHAVFEGADEPNINNVAKIKGNSPLPRAAALICEYPTEMREMWINSLRPSAKEKRLTLGLCEIASYQPSERPCAAEARRFLREWRENIDDAMEMLGMRSDEPRINELAEAIEKERQQKNPLTLADLAVHGDDVLPFCGGDRRRVGKLLDHLLDLVLDDPTLNTPEALINILKNNK